MKFSIITPSLNQLAYLKRCVASVADQATEGNAHRVERMEIHHHVQDAGSTDGTVEWLERYAHNLKEHSLVTGHSPPDTPAYTFSYSSEPDAGMYDALNKGIEHVLNSIRSDPLTVSRGDFPDNKSQTTNNSRDSVIAWLNCDEQYLPGVLAAVAGVFSQRPKVDLLHGDVLVVDPAGRLQGFWKSMPLRRSYIEAGYLYNLSCALFFRKHIFSAGCRFDASFRAAADQCLIVNLLRQGVVSAVMRTYVAAYTFMPDNLSEQRFAQVEREKLLRQAANQNRLSRAILRIMRQGERLLRGCRMQAFPLEYALYVDDMNARQHFTSARVSSRWPGVRKNHG